MRDYCTCPKCGTLTHINNDGRLRKHKLGAGICRGSGRQADGEVELRKLRDLNAQLVATNAQLAAACRVLVQVNGVLAGRLHTLREWLLDARRSAL